MISSPLDDLRLEMVHAFLFKKYGVSPAHRSEKPTTNLEIGQQVRLISYNLPFGAIDENTILDAKIRELPYICKIVEVGERIAVQKERGNAFSDYPNLSFTFSECEYKKGIFTEFLAVIKVKLGDNSVNGFELVLLDINNLYYENE